VSELRVAICGSGNRSRSVWQKHLVEQDGFELVGVQDVHPPSLEKSVAQGTIDEKRAFVDLDEMLRKAKPEAVIVCPVHSAHAAAATAVLEFGAHALVEKPFTTTLSDAERLADLADERALRLGVVQNWRTRSNGAALHRALAEDAIGDVSHVFFRYLRDRELAHLPEYLFEERDPLLYALTVHHIDLFRYVLGQEIATIEGHHHRPPWSRYEHPSLVQWWMETDGGVVISYTGTISSRNGGDLPWESIVVEGERGSIYNDTNTFDPPLWLSRRGEQRMDLTAGIVDREPSQQYALADLTILRNFAAAIAGSEPLISPARDNIGTVAAVEAAREALYADGPVEVGR
jgi:predicted dehydrogenase